MATSGSTDYSLTARGIVQAALEMIGVVPIGETAEAEHSTKALEQLNLMVKTWGASSDPKLWLLTEGSQALTASTASYTLTAARKVLSVRRRTSNNDTPLSGLGRSDYFDLPTKSATGIPNSWYFDPQRSARKLYIWPTADTSTAASTTLQYTYLRVIEDLDTLDDDFDLPQEWLEPLEVSLAARLILPFRVHITDPAGAALIQQRAESLYAQLSSYDEEPGSLFFQPASR